MPVSPPTFFTCLALDAAAVECRYSAFEGERVRNEIEIFEGRFSLATGGVRPSWASHVVVLLRLRRYPRMASRGEQVRARKGPRKVVAVVVV
jgi:hypothetical protein